jgi:predicted DNA-binding transcriptional regulator AlpA
MLNKTKCQPICGKIKSVSEITTLSPASIWRKLKDPNSNFPRPFKVGQNSTVWDLNEVQAWVEACKQTSGQ